MLRGQLHDLEGYSQEEKTGVAVARMVHTHVCSTGAICFFMGPRWLIYPIRVRLHQKTQLEKSAVGKVE